MKTATKGLFKSSFIQGLVINEDNQIIKSISSTRFITHFLDQLHSLFQSLHILIGITDEDYEDSVLKLKCLFSDMDDVTSFAALYIVLFFIRKFLVLFQKNEMRFGEFLSLLNRAVLRLIGIKGCFKNDDVKSKQESLQDLGILSKSYLMLLVSFKNPLVT